MSELTILCVSDLSYLFFVKTVFNSIKCNVKIPYRFHLHTINVSEKEIESFKNEYENIEFTNDKIELDDKPNINNAFGKSKKAAYCANIRAKILYDLMSKGVEYILYLDADSIVRKNLNELLSLIKQTDLIIFRRDEVKRLNLKVLTSVIGVNNNEKSFKFVECWKNFMLQEDILYSWFSDQRYFYETMLKCTDVKVHHLPKHYTDSSFSNESVIWNGKADRKFKDKKYIKEMRRCK